MSIFSRAKQLVTSPTGSVYLHVERDLAEKFGLSHDVVKDARAAHLQRGADWDLIKGLVTYSEAGRAKILRALGVQDEPVAATTLPASDPAATATDSAANIEPAATPGEKNAENQPAHGEVRELAFVKRVSNRRTVLARTAGGASAWVRVSDSSNFRPGMVLPARYLERDQWELARKAPRYPGKW